MGRRGGAREPSAKRGKDCFGPGHRLSGAKGTGKEGFCPMEDLFFPRGWGSPMWLMTSLVLTRQFQTDGLRLLFFFFLVFLSFLSFVVVVVVVVAISWAASAAKDEFLALYFGGFNDTSSSGGLSPLWKL